MRLLWIVNDFGCHENPIGCYAEKLIAAVGTDSRNIETLVENGSTLHFSKLHLCCSMRMTSTILRSCARVREGNIDAVIVEYPFIEYNPCIIIAYWLLRISARRHGCIVALSLHEYFRAKEGRKLVVRLLARLSDLLLVTDRKTQIALDGTASSSALREIFSPISCQWQQGEKKEYNRKFIYFGVINSSKAFSKMIDAFSEFNTSGEKRLDVYTSTRISVPQMPTGITVHYDCPDEEVAEALKKATYCILPILPEVGTYNSTLKGAAQAGCTLIGHFAEELSAGSFVVETKDYERDCFTSALWDAYKLPVEKLEMNSMAARRYADNYSVRKTMQDVLSGLRQTMREREGEVYCDKAQDLSSDK